MVGSLVCAATVCARATGCILPSFIAYIICFGETAMVVLPFRSCRARRARPRPYAAREGCPEARTIRASGPLPLVTRSAAGGDRGGLRNCRAVHLFGLGGELRGGLVHGLRIGARLAGEQAPREA